MNFRVFRGDFIVWCIFFFLIAISAIEVFSAGSYLVVKEGNLWTPFIRHSIFLFGAFVFAYVTHYIPCRFFKSFPIFGIPVSFGMLLYAMISGENLNSGARWISVMGARFQPSEFAKVFLIITIALLLHVKQREKGADKSAIKSILLLTFITCGMIVTQNFSTAALIFAVALLMMFIGRIPLKQLGILMAILGGLAISGYITLKALPQDPDDQLYQNRLMQRVPTWQARLFRKDLVKTPDPRDFALTDKNRQVVNARIAIARSEGLGVGPGRSVQRDRLSHAYSDFIFAIIGEETGFIGTGFVVFLYLLLLVRTGRIASRCSDNFPAFLVMGLGIMLVLQALLNMAVAVGMGPVTGQTLPLISKGGTSTLVTGFYFGMILSVSHTARGNVQEASS